MLAIIRLDANDFSEKQNQEKLFFVSRKNVSLSV